MNWKCFLASQFVTATVFSSVATARIGKSFIFTVLALARRAETLNAEITATNVSKPGLNYVAQPNLHKLNNLSFRFSASLFQFGDYLRLDYIFNFSPSHHLPFSRLQSSPPTIQQVVSTAFII